jgi:hypothetical protein
VIETLKERYNFVGQRNTQMIRRRKKRLREYNSDEDGDDFNEVDAENDLSTVFAHMV